MADLGINLGVLKLDLTRPVLYHVHGMPWQHWRITPAGNKTVTITSAISAHRTPRDWSPLHLRRQEGGDHQRWRPRPTGDGAAFLIESAAGPVTENPEWHASPHLWSSHWAAWQQWVICRLPMS